MKTSQTTVWISCDPLPPVAFDFTKTKEIIIGRHKRADFQLPHSCVSRSHASIKLISGKCLLLEDLGSSNGTFVNGRKITSHPIEFDDTISIGPFELEVRNTPFKQQEDNYGATNTDFLTTSRAASMAGQIKKTSLVEIFQNIEFNAKSGTLYVEDKDKDGFLVFASGQPIHARFGKLVDIPAVMCMLGLKSGNFVITDKVEPLNKGINTTITGLLLEFSRIQDEVQGESSDFFGMFS